MTPPCSTTRNGFHRASWRYTDGFGRSDTRQALREFFEVDRTSIVIAALRALEADGEIDDLETDRAH